MQEEKTDFVGFVHYFGVLTKNPDKRVCESESPSPLEKVRMLC